MNLTFHQPTFVWNKPKPANGISLENPLRFKLDGDVNSTAYATVLDSCSCIRFGKQVHAHLLKNGFHGREFVGTKLMQMYGKYGCLEDVVQMFDKMPERNLYTYTAILNLFLDNRLFQDAFICFQELLFEDVELEFFVFPVVLKICGGYGGVELGRQLHGIVLKVGVLSHMYVGNSLIDMYGKCGSLDDAKRISSQMSTRDCVSWNSMVTACAANGMVFEAMEFLEVMLRESDFTPNLVSWSALISGFAQNGYDQQAIDLLYKMRASGCDPNARTLVSVLPALGSALGACADSESLLSGEGIHSYCIIKGLESNLFVSGALVDMYCRCRELESAEIALRRVQERDVVIWNALISGYSRCNQVENMQSCHEFALQLFSEMQASKVKPDVYTVCIVLSACSRLATIERGKQIHTYAIRCGFESDTYIIAALIDMYAKCGTINLAKLVHTRTNKRSYNLVTQNAMLNAYAMHGYGDDGIALFRNMLMDGCTPDNVTFLAVLSSCVHAGAVDTGVEFFNLMGNYGVPPTLKHYTCLVDLLSHAGQLKQACKVIKSMPIDPDTVLWGALLNGCVIHGDVDLGKITASKLFKLEPNNSGNYVMLANLYASTARRHQLKKIRQHMKNQRLKKNPGCSWIEDKDETHVFMVCDLSHKRAKEIYDILDSLTAQMRLKQV